MSTPLGKRNSPWTGSFRTPTPKRRRLVAPIGMPDSPGLGTQIASRGFAPFYGTRRRNRLPIVPPEYKFYDRNEEDIIIVKTSPQSRLLFCPTLGSMATQRIGRRCVVRKLLLRGYFHITGTNSLENIRFVPPQMFRMLIFWDFQPNGTAPTILDVLARNSPYSPLNLSYRDRFRVVKDKTFVLDPLVLANGGLSLQYNTTVKQFKIFKAMAQTVSFNEGNAENPGTFADIATGALWMYLIGSAPPGQDGNWGISFNYESRVRFEDP